MTNRYIEYRMTEWTIAKFKCIRFVRIDANLLNIETEIENTI